MPRRRKNEKTLLQSLPIGAITARATPAVLILLCLTLIAFHRLGTLPVEKMRMAVSDIMAPVLATVSKPFVTTFESLEAVSTIRDLKSENIQLRDENEKLKRWYETALKAQAENQALRNLLNVKADPAMVFITARIISDPGGAFVKSLLLPVGTNDNVAKGNTVMSAHSMIGRVVEAGRRSARVLLVTDLNSRIPVMIQNTRTRGILAGNNSALMRLERLPLDSGLAVGQRIVTSGDGGQLPADVPIGVITEIGADGVVVAPLGDLEKLSYVQVINTGTETTPFAEGPLP